MDNRIQFVHKTWGGAWVVIAISSCKSLFVSILFHFKLMLPKLEHALITADLFNQNPTKKVMSLYKKLF